MANAKPPEKLIRLSLNLYCEYDFRFSIFPWTHTGRDDPNKLYCRNFWKIIYIFSGRSRKIIDGESYEIVPNMLLLVHPEERTRFEVPPGETLELCNIIFAPEVLDFVRPLLEPHEVFMKFFDPHKPVLSRSQRKRLYMVKADQAMGNMVRSMLREFELARFNHRGILRLQLAELLCRIARRCELLMRRSNGEMKARQAAEYLGEHYREPCSAEKLAEMLGVSRQYLHRIFTRAYGCSIHRALCRKRLMAACRSLVEEPERSISEICYAAGFNDLSYFYRKFREEFGCAPGDMREQAVSVSPEPEQ